MELPLELKQALERLQAGITDTADLETLRRALQAGQIVLATGERAVAIGGSVEDTVIVIGDNNIVFKGATAESVREALQQVLDRIASDRYAASLQEYFRSLRRYCAELPYLTLTDIRPPKNLDEVYVPLRARQRENEPSPRKPAAQEESLTVEQVLRQAQTHHLLILGQPGAGKSTLLRQLAERAYDAPHAIGLDRPHLPLLLPLRALARAEGALEERLNQALQNELRLTRPLPAGFLDAWPQRLDTPWLFLLDGLDEVPADRYLSLRQWISDLLAHPNIARVIITSRPSAYTEKEWESSRLSVYEIQPFTRDQTADLARRWFGEDAPTFLQALETVRSSVLIETPLLVTIAAKVYLERKSLPERRSQLYQEFVDIWLDEARERGLRDELGADVLDLAQPTLAHLALAMTEHPEWTDEKSLIPVVAKYLDEQLNLKARASAVAERFLRVMARRSGVFLKREEQYEWVHPTFREYFAALALNQQLESGKSFDEVLGRRALREEWAETIVMLTEVCADTEKIIAWLSNQASEQKSVYLATLASVCIYTTHIQLSEEELSPLIDILISDLHNSETHAIYGLMYIGAPAVESLITALNNPEANVRANAAHVLGEIGDARAVEPLVSALQDTSEYVRWIVALALAELGDKRAVETLLDYLRYDVPDIRWPSAEALGKIGGSWTIASLIEVLNDPAEKESTRYAAAETLGSIIGVSAIPHLIKLLNHPDWFVRGQAVYALGQTHDPSVIEPLIIALQDAEPYVRQQAALALQKFHDDRVVEPLITALSDTHAGVRYAAVLVLGNIGDARAKDYLITVALQDESAVEDNRNVAIGNREFIFKETTNDPLQAILRRIKPIFLKDAALDALNKIGVPFTDGFIRALNSANKQVVKNAIDALGKIGDSHALEQLCFLVDDLDDDLRMRVVKIFEKNCNSITFQALLKMLSDPSDSVSWAAFQSVVHILESKYQIPPYMSYRYIDGSEKIREAWNKVRRIIKEKKANILEALCIATDNDIEDSALLTIAEEVMLFIGTFSIEALINLFDDEKMNIWMKWRVASALGIIGEPAVEPLIDVLYNPDKNKDVYWYATIALQKIGVSAVEPLIAVLSHSDEYVRAQAAQALGEIGDVRAVEALIGILQDSNVAVRRDAAEALGKIGNAHAVEALIVALSDPHEDVRKSSAKALGKIGDSRAIGPLITLLHDKEAGGEAKDALAKIGKPAVDALITVLSDSDELVRCRVIDALGKIGDARAVEPLLTLLHDPNRDVRLRSADALGNIGDPRVLPELERLSREDQSAFVEATALWAIARIRKRMEKTA
jgi:HEAT repeat protein/energy-coupling factor transporter ATP-binding protein EcfA2